MKKLIVLLIALLLLSGCSKKITGEYLYKAIDNKSINSIDTNPPYEVGIYDSFNGVGLNYEDEEAKEIVDLFKEIKVGEKTDPIDGGYPYSVDFYFDEDFYAVYFVNDIVCLFDKQGNETYYKLENSGALKTLVKNRIDEAFSLNVDYIDVLDYEGFTVTQGEYGFNEDNDLVVELITRNDSDNAYAISISPMANGHEIHSYQTMICYPDSEFGYNIPIPTDVLFLYNTAKIGDVLYTVDVYSCDEESMDRKDLLYTSEVMTMSRGEAEDNLEKSDLIYSGNNVDVCLKVSEREMYSCLDLYIDNPDSAGVSVDIKGIEINGIKQDMNFYPEEVYKVVLNGVKDKFALLPLANYGEDEETGEYKKTELESLVLTIDVTRDGNTETIVHTVN